MRMAKGHWLDPMARRLLQATGQLPKDPARPATAPAPASAAAPVQPSGAADPAINQEEVERELLALRLAQDPRLRLRDAAEVRRAAALGWRLDVNRATAADWRRLPGCRPEHVDLLLRLQSRGIQLSGAEDLQRLLELDGATVAAWEPLLEFHWYGEPPAPAQRPLEVNQATARELQQTLALNEERTQRLLRERARQPFRDLADLQERLQFPPALLEGWIGRVRFSPGPAGPRLPRPSSAAREPHRR
ncbi:MAG: hypothetical protein VKJ66_02435 [Synechococcus sp.]|nr:hypothetical protein [Synechococcus sp.]